VGFSNFDIPEKRIYAYEDIKSEPYILKARNINSYLVEGNDQIILSRQHPLNNVPKMVYGNKPVDGGHLIIEDNELEDLISTDPRIAKYIRPLLSAKEFLNGKKRWCLWLVKADPTEIRTISILQDRIKKVKEFRLTSIDPGANKLASIPSQFRDINNPALFILVPRHSSETRKYIPLGFFTSDFIPSDSCMVIPDTNNFHFGILTSEIHMTWVRHICGRLESRFRYSKDIVYNNFPWPENPSEKQVKTVEEAAQKVLDTRAMFPGSSLADLYDPLTMPPELVRAHRELDRAVDLCYRPQPFINDTKRIEFLFELYDKYTVGLFAEEKMV